MELHQNQERLRVSYGQTNTIDNELSELADDPKSYIEKEIFNDPVFEGLIQAND